MPCYFAKSLNYAADSVEIIELFCKVETFGNFDTCLLFVQPHMNNTVVRGLFGGT